jgi:hypothetical protein
MACTNAGVDTSVGSTDRTALSNTGWAITCGRTVRTTLSNAGVANTSGKAETIDRLKLGLAIKAGMTFAEILLEVTAFLAILVVVIALGAIRLAVMGSSNLLTRCSMVSLLLLAKVPFLLPSNLTYSG